MVIANINPTRMELTRLKKELAVASKGHRLLKDKRDELMRQFLELVKQSRVLRARVEEKLAQASGSFAVASSVLQHEVLTSALLMPRQRLELAVDTRNIMSVDVPVFEVKKKGAGDVFSYGYAFTSGELDASIRLLADAQEDLLRLAEAEKAVQLLASEIEKTRRRVNALEYVMIPNYQDTIKYIAMKLDENERSNLTRLMKVKDMMVEEQIRKSQRG